MSERAKVLLYTVIASGLLFLAVDRFLGTTDDHASRLDIRNTSRTSSRGPDIDGVVEARNPIDASAPVRAEADPTLAVASEATAASGEGTDEQEQPENEGDEERLSVADAERSDSDGDMDEEPLIAVAGTSPEEVALLERIDGDLLRGRAPTRALDVVLAGCTVGTGEGAPGGGGGASRVTTRPDIRLGVYFRHASVAIKGASLNRIDALIERLRRCDTALLVVQHSPEGRVDVNDDPRLVTRREEELKYYLLQRRVPTGLMRFPESS